MNEHAQIPPGVDPARPAPARIYDYLLSGENNFQSDRDAAKRIMALVPEIKDCAWANRGFHQRAARWIAGRGIRQFIDIGAGLPTVGNTHDVVRSVEATCRVAYVDNDPMVRAQSGPLLNGATGVKVILGDLRDPERLLADPQLRTLIDFSRPTGLLMTAVMHFVADDSDPQGLMRQYLAALASGSYLALSHLTSDHKPPRAVREFRRVFARATEQMHFRSRPEVERLFDRLKLVSPRDPGGPGRLCYVGDWEAEDADLADSDGSRWLYCGVARRPLPESRVPRTRPAHDAGRPATRSSQAPRSAPTCDRTSWTAQLLPSGSVKKTNFPPSLVGSSTCTGVTSTPRSASCVRAASMSGTTSCRLAEDPRSVPGGATLGPTTTEHADPGGVMCTTRIVSVGRVSASRWNPSVPV
jgi:hypothetical protein